ncbi:hypothetical protein A0H81_03658 [Grifola frondosa]|uniref:Uncharacterized protein n=1 Tax=Grifola frondosa TaxID=5627 RepID=A0A1C7MKP2_GRIFR|nr:hypothetical protein A0H81_03658 [Grifola frondosa]
MSTNESFHVITGFADIQIKATNHLGQDAELTAVYVAVVEITSGKYAILMDANLTSRSKYCMVLEQLQLSSHEFRYFLWTVLDLYRKINVALDERCVTPSEAAWEVIIGDPSLEFNSTRKDSAEDDWCIIGAL